MSTNKTTTLGAVAACCAILAVLFWFRALQANATGVIAASRYGAITVSSASDPASFTFFYNANYGIAVVISTVAVVCGILAYVLRPR
jgi:hypothetical protein